MDRKKRLLGSVDHRSPWSQLFKTGELQTRSYNIQWDWMVHVAISKKIYIYCFYFLTSNKWIVRGWAGGHFVMWRWRIEWRIYVLDATYPAFTTIAFSKAESILGRQTLHRYANISIIHNKIWLTAVRVRVRPIIPKYCRYGNKHSIINQSKSDSVTRFASIFPSSNACYCSWIRRRGEI